METGGKILKTYPEIIAPMVFLADKEPQGFLSKVLTRKSNVGYQPQFSVFWVGDFIKENHYENFVDLVQYDVPITAQNTEPL